jgi:hypothetical protein
MTGPEFEVMRHRWRPDDADVNVAVADYARDEPGTGGRGDGSD